MHIWMFDIHPFTAPLANEVSFAITQSVKLVLDVYNGVLVPVVSDIALVVKFVN